MIAWLDIPSWGLVGLGVVGSFGAGYALVKALPSSLFHAGSRAPKPRSFRRPFPSWLKERSRKKRIDASREVLPQALEIAIQGMKAGQTVPQTLEYLSQEAPPPLREEFAAVCNEMAWGASAEQALSHLAERVPTPDIERFLESYRLSRKTGANLTHLLQTLHDGMEERNRLIRRMEAMTAQARLSGILMGCLPLFLAVILAVMDPLLMAPLFTTLEGWAILSVALALELAGFLWIKRLMVLET